MIKILFIFGTRPEAIKLAPLINVLKGSSKFDTKVLITGQHRHMLDQVLNIFEIKPDFDLNLMKEKQDLTDITSLVLSGCRDFFKKIKPDLVIVHGDTSTTFAASLAAFYQKIDVAHVEAGLRTHNNYSPYPEELNRVLTSRIAKFHFAPTIESSKNLLLEGHKRENVIVTGNTVIDSLFYVLNKIKSDAKLKERISNSLKEQIPNLGNKKLILITGHRRENLEGGLVNICNAISELAKSYDNVDFVYPVHLNPVVQSTVKQILKGKGNVHLIDPLEYFQFTYLMGQSYLIITDSGGIQEEAPSLGIPVLVTRESTERPEAVAAGVVKLVGADTQKIIFEVSKLLSNPVEYEAMIKNINPYGNGEAAKAIALFLENRLTK